MTAFLVAVALVAAFFLGRATIRRPVPAAPAAPASLESHVATLREVLAAADELTPETEAWLGAIGKKALPGARRPLLEGAARAAYDADWTACRNNPDSSEGGKERYCVIRRWHAKGFRFPDDLRATLLAACDDRAARDTLRGWFDEQDANS